MVSINVEGSTWYKGRGQADHGLVVDGRAVYRGSCSSSGGLSQASVFWIDSIIVSEGAFPRCSNFFEFQHRNTSLVVWARTGAHMANQPWMLPFIGHASAHGWWLAPLCLNFYDSCSCWEWVVSSSVRPIPAKITAIIMWWWCESFRFVSITVSGIFLKWWVQLQLMKSRLDIPSVQQNKELGFLWF